MSNKWMKRITSFSIASRRLALVGLVFLSGAVTISSSAIFAQQERQGVPRSTVLKLICQKPEDGLYFPGDNIEYTNTRTLSLLEAAYYGMSHEDFESFFKSANYVERKLYARLMSQKIGGLQEISNTLKDEITRLTKKIESTQVLGKEAMLEIRVLLDAVGKPMGHVYNLSTDAINSLRLYEELQQTNRNCLDVTLGWLKKQPGKTQITQNTVEQVKHIAGVNDSAFALVVSHNANAIRVLELIKKMASEFNQVAQNFDACLRSFDRSRVNEKVAPPGPGEPEFAVTRGDIEGLQQKLAGDLLAIDRKLRDSQNSEFFERKIPRDIANKSFSDVASELKGIILNWKDIYVELTKLYNVLLQHLPANGVLEGKCNILERYPDGRVLIVDPESGEYLVKRPEECR